MRGSRFALAGVLLLAVALGVGPRAQEGRGFDKLSDKDRAVFAARFKNEIWPMLKRGGARESCVTCHLKTRGTLRFSGNPDRDFARLLRDGFLLKDDAGSLLERIADKDARWRMPPKLPPWKAAEHQGVSRFHQ